MKSYVHSAGSIITNLPIIRVLGVPTYKVNVEIADGCPTLTVTLPPLYLGAPDARGYMCGGGSQDGRRELEIQYEGSCYECARHVPRLAWMDKANYWCEKCMTVFYWDRSVGLRCYPAKLEDGRVVRRVEDSFLKSPEELKPAKEHKPEIFSDTYESCYWKFVTAEDWEHAKYWQNQMLSMVTLNLQPRPDGKSWVEERTVKKSHKDRQGKIALMLVCSAIFAGLIICGMQLMGIWP